MNQSLQFAALGAFFGAFFAFLFGLITFWIQKKRERFFLHKNAVVELEYLLNDHLNDIAKNRYLIEHDLPILKEKKFTYDRLHQFRVPEGIELKLGDLDVINRYVSYKESITRLNNDFNGINSAFENLTSFAIIRGEIPHELNFTHLVVQLEMLDKFLSSLLVETKDLLSFVRLYLKKLDSFREKVVDIYKLNGYMPITKAEIKQELKTLEKEINQTMEESREKIKKAVEEDGAK